MPPAPATDRPDALVLTLDRTDHAGDGGSSDPVGGTAHTNSGTMPVYNASQEAAEADHSTQPRLP
jgi:hypothetical protein